MNTRILAGLLLAALFTLDGAGAAEILVNEEVDDGCTLRDAVRAANADAPRGDCPAGSGADTIRIVQSDSESIRFNNPALPINSTITIESHVPGQRVSIDRNIIEIIPHRIFDINAGSLILSDVEVRWGLVSGLSMDGGGCIRVRDGMLIMNNTVVTYCAAESTQAGGGAILARNSVVEIIDSNISNNSVGQASTGAPPTPSAPGILAFDSSVYIYQTRIFELNAFNNEGVDRTIRTNNKFHNSLVTIESSTLFAQDDEESDPLITLENSSDLLLVNSTLFEKPPGVSGISPIILDDSTLTLANSTVEDFDIQADNSGTVNFINSIFLGTCTNGVTVNDVINSIFTQSHCTQNPTPSSELLLYPSGENGGPTRTRALHPSSIALDLASVDFCPDTDQRGEPRVASECDIGAFELIANADVQISAVPATPGPYFVGQVVPFNLNVFNDGPDTAFGVAIEVELENATLQSVDGDCSALPCELGALNAEELFQQIQIEVVPIANGLNEFTVTATALPAPDSVYDEIAVADNTSVTTRSLSPAADVSITKELQDPPPYFVGQTIEYEIIVRNDGPDFATSPVMTDTPVGLDIISISNCSGPTAGPCSLPGLTAGSSSTLTVTAEITGTEFDNVAEVSADQADPFPGNNVADRGNRGSTENDADLRVNLTPLAAPPYLNSGFLDFEVEVRNAGPDAATNVRVNVDVGTGRYLIINIAGDCGPAMLPCELGTIPVGSSETFTIQGQLVSDGSESVTVYAQANQTDADPETNEARRNFTVQQTVDVIANMTLESEPPFFEGQMLVYEINVFNIGFNSADNVVIDVVPDNLVIDSVLGTNCFALPCTVPTIGPTETILVTATPPEIGAFDLTVSAFAEQMDTHPANNVDDTDNGGNAEVNPADIILKDSFEPFF